MSEVHLIRPSLAMAIRDVILLGHVAEIDAVLILLQSEDQFPEELRSGLEALRHFRANYGVGGEMQPTDQMQKKKMTLMETAWGAELLEMLRRHEDKTTAKSA